MHRSSEISKESFLAFIMRIIDIVSALSSYFPRTGMTFGSAKTLGLVAPNTDPQKYAAASIFIAFSAAVLAGVLAFVFGGQGITSLICVLLVFSLSGFLLLKLPDIEYAFYIRRIELELPPALRMLAMFIEFGMPFQKAVAVIAEENTALGIELRKVLADVNAGASLGKALSHLAEKIKSQHFKRTFAQILSCYEHGQSGKELRSISDELLAIQQHAFRDAATRASTLGLLFVASSALLPTFFIIAAVIGPALLSFYITEQLFIITLILLFPALSFMILLLAKASLPLALFRSERKSDWRFVALIILPSVLVLFFQNNYAYLLCAVVLVLLLFFLYDKYKKERRREQFELLLPDAMLSISTLPKGSSLEKVLLVIAKGSYGPLSEEASSSLRQLKAGLRPEVVLEDLGARSGSQIAVRVFRALAYAINTNSLDRLSEIAEDMLKFLGISRERSAMLGMQKYTLIFGGLFVPLILKIALSLIASMQHFLDPSMFSLLEIAERSVPAYLGIYSLLASYYISDIEDKESLFAVYFVLLLAAGLIIFSFLAI